MTELCHTETASQKKSQIESGMLNLMRQRPYQEITVTDICREAEIPRRTFYHYFSGKEDVLDTMTETLIQQCFLEGMFDVRLGKAHMEKVFVQIFHFWEGENREKLDLLIKNGLESRLISWSSLWVRKEQLGYIRKNDMEPQLVEIGLMVGLTGFFSLLFYWSRGGYRESAVQMAQYAILLLPHAVFNA